MRHRFNPLAWTLFLTLPAAVLCACSFTPARDSAELHTYVLSPDLPSMSDPVGSENRGTAVLLVTVPRARAGFDSLRMAYLLRPHEVRYYANNQWADTPGRMLAPLLGRTLARTGTWRTVVQLPSSVRGDYRLDADDLVLQQEFFSKPSLVRLTLRLQLTELKGQGILGTRSFEVLEEAPSDDPYGGVLAANKAVAKLLADVASWVGACLNEQGGRRC